jgi:hypothetical protein
LANSASFFSLSITNRASASSCASCSSKIRVSSSRLFMLSNSDVIIEFCFFETTTGEGEYKGLKI